MSERPCTTIYYKYHGVHTFLCLHPHRRPSLAHHLEAEEEEEYIEAALASGDLAADQVARLRIRSWLAGMRDSRRQGAFMLKTTTDDMHSALYDCKC